MKHELPPIHLVKAEPSFLVFSTSGAIEGATLITRGNFAILEGRNLYDYGQLACRERNKPPGDYSKS